MRAESNIARRTFAPELDPGGKCALYVLLAFLFPGEANIPPHLRPAFPPRPLAPESQRPAA